jgi:hypothetical protein
VKSKFITHQDKRILLADYSGLGVDIKGLKAEMGAAIALAHQEPLNSLLTLTDVRGTIGTPTMLAQMKDTARKIAPHMRKHAVVGSGGVQAAFLNLGKAAGNKAFVMFDDMDKAKEWLVAD